MGTTCEAMPKVAIPAETEPMTKTTSTSVTENPLMKPTNPVTQPKSLQNGLSNRTIANSRT